jgi:hypothetical protein
VIYANQEEIRVVISSKDIAGWLSAAKLGHKKRDRIIFFIHIAAAITVIVLLLALFGKKRGARILLQNLGLINWIPIDSVMAKLNYNGQDLSCPFRYEWITQSLLAIYGKKPKESLYQHFL